MNWPENMPWLHYDRDALTAAGIPRQAAEFMAREGLPVLRNIGHGDLESIVFYEQEKIFYWSDKGGFVVIGELYGIHYLCVSTEDGGVYIIDDGLRSDASALHERGLLNSWLPRLLRFIKWHYRLTAKLEERKCPRLAIALTSLRYRLLDGMAMCDNKIFTLL